MVREVEMYETQGKNIKVVCTDGKEIVGFCEIFTQAIDNEPEIASITIKEVERNGYTEILQNEIKSIEMIK